MTEDRGFLAQWVFGPWPRWRNFLSKSELARGSAATAGSQAMNETNPRQSTVLAPLSPEEFEAAIRRVGAERYHDKHTFHKLLHGGKLDKGQVQAWALNRYCYQEAVPRKDAAFISRVHDRALRREWISRIHDHDGLGDEPGGIERWLVLTDGLGLDRDYVISMSGALPATRHIVESYVRLVREKPLVVAVASSLTELFAPSIHRERIAGMLENYEFIGEDVMAYFKKRLSQAPRDSDFALGYVKANALTREEQEACVDAVRFKCDVLWAQLDVLNHAYVTPALVPPGAFVPGNN
jgi:coenzyme PQQ biosynthesis protein C